MKNNSELYEDAMDAIANVFNDKSVNKSITVDLRTLQGELDNMAELLKGKTDNTLTCVYCGKAYPEGTPPHGSKVLTDHIKICPKHPMREAERKIMLLRGAIVGLIGGCETIVNSEDTVADLREKLEDEAGEHIVLDAMQALLDTEPDTA